MSMSDDHKEFKELLALFGEAVLMLMDEHEEWGADFTGAIQAEARLLGLAREVDANPLFVSVL